MNPGSEHDQLAVGGTAALAGELNVVPINGFRPHVGQQFTILTAGSVSERFDMVTGPGVFGVTYNPQTVVLTVVAPPISGDWDQDGDIDLDDYAVFSTCMTHLQQLLDRGTRVVAQKRGFSGKISLGV